MSTNDTTRKKVSLNKALAIEQRRKKVAFLLANSVQISQTEIAKQLDTDKATISRDIQYLRSQATTWVFKLAKENLAHFYKATIDDIDRAKQEAWKIYYNKEDKDIRTYDKLKALNTIIVANVKRFELLTQGPTILSMKAMSERLQKIEENRR